VLTAYVLRCPTIGYCQGWNSIAARLLAVMPEEEAFWVLVQLVEVVLPLDQYSNLLGVLVDIKVFGRLMERLMP
jgi:small G protein signaling modulator 3